MSARWGLGSQETLIPFVTTWRIPTAGIRHMAGWRYGIQVAIELENRRWVRLLHSCVASLIRAGTPRENEPGARDSGVGFGFVFAGDLCEGFARGLGFVFAGERCEGLGRGPWARFRGALVRGDSGAQVVLGFVCGG